MSRYLFPASQKGNPIYLDLRPSDVGDMIRYILPKAAPSLHRLCLFAECGMSLSIRRAVTSSLRESRIGAATPTVRVWISSAGCTTDKHLGPAAILRLPLHAMPLPRHCDDGIRIFCIPPTPMLKSHARTSAVNSTLAWFPSYLPPVLTLIFSRISLMHNVSRVGARI